MIFCTAINYVVQYCIVLVPPILIIKIPRFNQEHVLKNDLSFYFNTLLRLNVIQAQPSIKNANIARLLTVLYF